MGLLQWLRKKVSPYPEIDWQDDTLPRFSESQLPDIPEEEKDKIIKSMLGPASKLMILHLDTLKLNYIEGRVVVENKLEGEEYFEITIRRLQSRLGNETLIKYPQAYKKSL